MSISTIILLSILIFIMGGASAVFFILPIAINRLIRIIVKAIEEEVLSDLSTKQPFNERIKEMIKKS